MENVFLITFLPFFWFPLIISINVMTTAVRMTQTQNKVHLLDKIHYLWRKGTILTREAKGGIYLYSGELATCSVQNTEDQ